MIDRLKIAEITDSITQRIQNIPVLAISNETQDGFEALKALIEKGKTYCMLGSSGVGKSTMLNMLAGRTEMKTGEISSSTSKGRHVTSHRELILLESGGMLIDNPGMREVGIADQSQGLETTFDVIYGLAKNCKFIDCTHTAETGCAVLEAVENGAINRKSYESYLKMARERERFEASVMERRRKDKDFGKMIKNYHKDMKKVKT